MRPATTTSRALRSAPPSAARCCRARDIAAGDVLIGLASSGVHSNGFSLVRKIVETLRPRLGCAGALRAGMTLGDALLDPTRIYVKSCLRAIRETGAVKGARPHHRRRLHRQHSARAAEASRRRHRSGAAAGAAGVQWLAEQGGIAELEMLRTFNCGIGMIAIVKAGRDRAGH